MGDIGPIRREVTFEPIPDDVTVIEPTPAPVPEREPVEAPA
jgi:hypothetical protein